ncbi:hypothetical protein JXC34_02215 [Candidatus Woesearchaeota archaeon]|nr:hypothetical protein [Candidatus Woesearchaeota archaeon]
MKQFKEALETLSKNKEYCKWKKENKNSYLTHGFIMASEDVTREWQIGFYNPEHKKIAAFTVGKKIYMNPESDVFTDKKTVSELDVDKIKINADEALETADKLQKEKYSAHTPLKKIIIIQNLDVGQVWNITYVTGSFKTLNIKINSSTGKVITDELIDIFKVEK